MDVQNTLKNNLSRIDCRGKEENLSSRRGDNSYSCPSLSNSGRFLLHYIILTSLRGWGKTHLFNLNFSWRTENCVFMPWTKRILRIHGQNQSDVAELCKLVIFREKIHMERFMIYCKSKLELWVLSGIEFRGVLIQNENNAKGSTIQEFIK